MTHVTGQSKLPKAIGGFTLVELVAVLVILGILSAVAIPRFVDLSVSAQKASVQRLSGAISSAVNQAASLAFSEGETAATGHVFVEGNRIDLIYGYPDAASATSDLLPLLIISDTFNGGANCSTSDWCYVGNISAGIGYSGLSFDAGKYLIFWPRSYGRNDYCLAYYWNPSDGRPAGTGAILSGC